MQTMPLYMLSQPRADGYELYHSPAFSHVRVCEVWSYCRRESSIVRSLQYLWAEISESWCLEPLALCTHHRYIND